MYLNIDLNKTFIKITMGITVVESNNFRNDIRSSATGMNPIVIKRRCQNLPRSPLMYNKSE